MFSSQIEVCGISRGSQRSLAEKEGLKAIKVVYPHKEKAEEALCVFLKVSEGLFWGEDGEEVPFKNTDQGLK